MSNKTTKPTRSGIGQPSPPPDTPIPPAKVGTLRAVAPPPARTIKRTFTLDHPLGEVVVTIKGPAGASKFRSTHTSFVISTEGELEELSSSSSSLAPARRAAPARPLSGDPNEPGGTIEASLDGDDAGDAAHALTPHSLSFLEGVGKDMMRRVSQE